MKLNRSKTISICLLVVFFTLFLGINSYAIADNQTLGYDLQSTSNPASIQALSPTLNPKVIRPTKIHDADGDKIADSLSAVISKKAQNPSFTAKAIQGENIKVTICVDKKPNAVLIDKLRGYGAEIDSVHDNLIYAMSATIPIDKLNVIAADSEVTLIEKEGYSTAHLDTSTINMGARGSSYVWDAGIKGNSDYAIAILDTGVDSSHTDMGNFLYFQDFTSHGYPSGSTGVDYGHHGTHVASIAAGTGNADTTTQTVEQTISYYFHSSPNWYWTTHWFEVKDHPNNPSTSVTLDWDDSGVSPSADFGILDSSGSWITGTGPYTTSPNTHNLGNLAAGWYQVYCDPNNLDTAGRDYTITIEHESEYTLGSEPANTPVFTGVAPQSKIVSLKILDDTGSGTGTWLQNALTWISNNGKDPAYNITTVSMSIGFDGVYSSIDTAVNNLVDEGFICVASAGNDGTNYGNNAVDSPGSAQKCITVGAVNDAYEVTYYSSNGDLVYNKPDVIAPGGTIVLSGSNSVHNLIVAADSNYGEDDNSMADVEANDYRGMQGTSMSAPHVSGLVQLAIDAIVQTEGNWIWSQANALRIKQLICMGTWEVQAGETFDGDGDGISQNPPLNRVGPDVVEGYGMVRADAVIQAITHPTTSEFTNQVYDLDRRNDSYALKQKILLFGFDAQVGQAFNFSLDVPATGDFDLIIYDDDYSFSTGRPIVEMSSLTSGLDVDESLLFIPTEAGTYYWSIRAVEGYGSASVSLDILSAPTFLNPTPSDGSTGVSINPSLSLTVSDPDGDLMNVSFYNASDDSSIGNDTNVPSDDTASITWLGLVEGTSYSWYVKINDGILMTKSGSFSFTTLSDNPTWDETPTNQAVEVNDDFRYDLNASDTSGIASWWINDTVSFSIDSNGVIRDKGTLEIGDYWLEVRVYDPYDNYLSATFKVNVFIGIPTPGFLLEYLISGLVVIALVLIVKRRQK